MSWRSRSRRLANRIAARTGACGLVSATVVMDRPGRRPTTYHDTRGVLRISPWVLRAEYVFRRIARAAAAPRYGPVPVTPPATPPRRRTLIGGFWVEPATCDGWYADSIKHPRFTVHTWQFGARWQCTVMIAGSNAHALLPAQPTWHAALSRGRAWITHYVTHGPTPPDVQMAEMFRECPMICRTRADVLERWFFVGATGSAWLDGALFDQDQSTPEERAAHAAEREADERSARSRWSERARAEHDLMTAQWEEIERSDIARGRPLPDDGALRSWYPVGDGSIFNTAPDDVRPEWRALLIEAARLLVERTKAEVWPQWKTAEQAEAEAERQREQGRAALRRWGAADGD